MAFTFFFRDLPVIEHAATHAVKLAAGRMKMKVWDAGSAMGQEPYTLAIVLAEKMGKFAFKTFTLTPRIMTAPIISARRWRKQTITMMN